MLVTVVGVLGTDRENVQQGAGPQPHIYYSCGGIGRYLFECSNPCVAHHQGNDLASVHYNVYGDTHLRDPLGVIPGQTSVHRQAAMWQL